MIAIAGAKEGLLKVLLNGEGAEHLINETFLVNDGAIYRSATLSGRYRRIEIPITPDRLQAGENTILLENQNGMVMYDTILLLEEA